MDQNARTEAAINDLELEAVRETLSKCFPGEIISTRDVDSYVRQQPTNLQEDTLVTT
jgi:non-canonical (house-cleaning) NTP pyrophosphatase